MKKLGITTAAFILATSGNVGLSGSAEAKHHKKSGDAINLSTTEGALAASRKVQCSLKDGEAVTYHWTGKAYSRRMGERDKHLFNLLGMNVRACSKVEDAKRGKGYKLVSRELLFYTDVKTGEILKTWENPWTGEETNVLHVANDPVNFISYQIGRDGKPTVFGGDFMGDRWHMTTTVPLFYPNPLGGAYQKEVGGTYHATEMFNFFGTKDDLLDSNKHTADVGIGWVRMSDWLPWMMMGGRDGIIYMHTAGRKLISWDEMPEMMKAEIRENYPDYVGPPPLDDPRKNVTSWEYYKTISEEKDHSKN